MVNYSLTRDIILVVIKRDLGSFAIFNSNCFNAT